MTKLIIQIPCFNEEEHLSVTLRHLPRKIPGIDRVEVLIIDDGSSDRTVEVARREGVEHIIHFPNHRGLAPAFMAGIDAAVRLGADIIVNTDGDDQYHGADIEKLIRPILEGNAEMVVGDRAPHSLPHFPPWKRVLQHYGSWVVRQLSGTEIPDATSGFRALSREAALRLNVFTGFTYTLETIIQAGKKQIPISHVPVKTNAQRRESRLFANTGSYVRQSAATIVRIYALYEPLKVFFLLGGTLVLGAMAIGCRFLYYYFTSGGGGHVQSLILAAILAIVGFQTMLIGLVADLIGSNRHLTEDILYRLRKIELHDQTPTH